MAKDEHWLTEGEDYTALMPELPDSRVELYPPQQALDAIGIERLDHMPPNFKGSGSAPAEFGTPIADLRKAEGVVSDPITGRKVQIDMEQAETIAKKASGRVVLRFVNDDFNEETFKQRVEEAGEKLD